MRYSISKKINQTIIYGLLLLGAVAMLFPFVWMLSTSLKTENAALEFPPRWIPSEKIADFWINPVNNAKIPIKIIGKNIYKYKNNESKKEEYRQKNTIRFFLESDLFKADSKRYRLPLEAVKEKKVFSIGIYFTPKFSFELGGDGFVLYRYVNGNFRNGKFNPGKDITRVDVVEKGDAYIIVRELKSIAPNTSEIEAETSRIVSKRAITLHFDNYQRAWKQAPFARYFFNSIFIAVITTFFQIIFGTMAAYVFARFNFKYKELLFMGLLATMMVPPQVLTIPNYSLLAKLGWIDTYYALIVPWVASMATIYFLRQHIQTIPESLFDAAVIDGCNHPLIFKTIIIPLSKTPITAMGLFTFIASWNTFLWPLIVTNSPEMRPLQVGLANFSQGNDTLWTLLMAASAFSIAPLVVVYFFAQKQFIEGLAKSGLKE